MQWYSQVGHIFVNNFLKSAWLIWENQHVILAHGIPGLKLKTSCLWVQCSSHWATSEAAFYFSNERELEHHPGTSSAGYWTQNCVHTSPALCHSATFPDTLFQSFWKTVSWSINRVWHMWPSSPTIKWFSKRRRYMCIKYLLKRTFTEDLFIIA